MRSRRVLKKKEPRVIEDLLDPKLDAVEKVLLGSALVAILFTILMITI